MSAVIEFVIPLEPVPASRARYSSKSRRAYHSDKYQNWLDAAQEYIAAAAEDYDLMTGPVAVEVEVVCSKPKKPTNPYPRGDYDNYLKATLDAITHSGCVWKDDVQVVRGEEYKVYADPGEHAHTWVRITGLTRLPPRAARCRSGANADTKPASEPA